MKNNNLRDGIPVSPLLSNINKQFKSARTVNYKKGRLIKISLFAIAVSVFISLIARLLVSLINLVTNVSFYGLFDTSFHSPAANHLGPWVIVIPAIGGILVGLMALYGSAAIRGHGIPEAMEQILVNQSKIKPAITILKPISSAIAIGTGGPFGAEGPIIATGGALGSTIGQLFKISPAERKVILAAGATAGMSAIFGTPIAAVLLAIELLLFEFSPRSILPVALACITGAAGHHLLFEAGPVFPMPHLTMPSNLALGTYSAIGLVIGFFSLLITKAVYFIEDLFEKLPVHWAWWPALGGLAVGLIGYFAPHTLGVGYDNITGILSGKLTFALVLSLCCFKLLSWLIALGSGTSGGTLAPLLTIGGATGAVLCALIQQYLPGTGINVPMAALIGMSAMFAGASRAYLTSVTFALEATMQSNALLPLLGACTASYLVSFFLMENTIMTEKIARRGVATPDSYHPDVLEKLKVGNILTTKNLIVKSVMSIAQLKQYIVDNRIEAHYIIAVDSGNQYTGTIKMTDLYGANTMQTDTVTTIAKAHGTIKPTDTLRAAVETLSGSNTEVLAVIENNNNVVGVLSYKDIIAAYAHEVRQNENESIHISLKRKRLQMILKGKNFRKKQLQP
jgi:CIC family chloride channel protein